jgi:CheY-like chemotaxis protein
MDGFEVCRRLHPEDVAATKAAGFDAHLAKLVDPARLLLL